jgi:hypothetical protein
MILGYGEDPLTFWALKSKLPDILKVLNDKSAPSDCLIFYRPSFGRGGGTQSQRAEFGEFDAIMGTPKATFLIESKWASSSEVKNGVVYLRAEQELRHQIFKWYLSEWTSGSFNNWGDFVEQRMTQFDTKFKTFNKKMVPENSLLANNLEYILNRLKAYCPKVQKDVLLFFSTEAVHPTKVIPAHFQLIPIQYKTLNNSQLFQLD